jgi:hypothetical protein
MKFAFGPNQVEPNAAKLIEFQPVLSANSCPLRAEAGSKRIEAQVQRRTLTPLTHTVLQTTAGLRTTTAPRAPAQPARTTPRAQTTALASVASKVMVAEKDSTAAAISRKARMVISRTGTG